MPLKRSTPEIMHRAGKLRKDLTPAERKLWAWLRLLREDGYRFRRQHAIGRYIVDFCAPRSKLILEVDGSQHLEQKEYDQARTAWLEGEGYRVLRFTNGEVMNDIEQVMGVIKEALPVPTGHPPQIPKSGI